MVRRPLAARTGEWADALNRLPKYVVSATLTEPRWSNATVLKGDATCEVSKLKDETTGDIVVYGSYGLVRCLVTHDLVDEFRLFIFPVVLGAGERLFAETNDKLPLRLAGARSIGNGLTHLTYEVIHAAVPPVTVAT